MAGIYIHIPFCAKRCTYCDFHFSTSFSAYRSEMITSICKEIGLRRDELSEPAETVYFGGGTPSLLTLDEMAGILTTVKQTFGIHQQAEITLECNPDDCSDENLDGWYRLGINRLSIGIQTLDDSHLAWMNRTHTTAEARDVVARASRFGFDDFSIDLIYGLPGQSLEHWTNTLEEVMSWNINHLSAYCLTVESGTHLEKLVEDGRIPLSENEDQAAQFEALIARAKVHGFEQYEISNFARNQRYSRHNSNYWRNRHYVGIGPSAHGFTGDSRYWNVRNNSQYIKALNQGELPQTVEILSSADKFNEMLMIGLRTSWGVELSALTRFLNPDSDWYTKLEAIEQQHDARISNGKLILTEKGRLRADAIAASLFL